MLPLYSSKKILTTIIVVLSFLLPLILSYQTFLMNFPSSKTNPRNLEPLLQNASQLLSKFYQIPFPKSEQSKTLNNLSFDNIYVKKFESEKPSIPLQNHFRYVNWIDQTLHSSFFHKVSPTPLSSPYFIAFSPDVANLIDLDPNESWQNENDFVMYLSGNKVLPNSNPVAMLYCGHQFGQFVSMLGDGRAILLGQVRNSKGEIYDLHMKGGGQTLFSRRSDGRAVLRSSIREFLCSEAMAYLNVPTTRALSLIGSDDPVFRETVETSAVVVRVSPSHVRFGSFEVFHYRNETENVKLLADYVIENFYPTLVSLPETERYIQFFEQVVKRTAITIAKWQAIGFAHGVLNTDNMSILGLTMDYGPFGFVENYDPEYICNHSDYEGRYSFENQPGIGKWNLKRLFVALSSLPEMTNESKLLEIFEMYNRVYFETYMDLMASKLGFCLTLEPNVSDLNQNEDVQLINKLLSIMKKAGTIDYTNFFRAISNLKLNFVEEQIYTELEAEDATLKKYLLDRDTFMQQFFSICAVCNLDSLQKQFYDWLQEYYARLKKQYSFEKKEQVLEFHQKMRSTNPKYIPKNYVLQKAIEKATKKDFSVVNQLLKIFQSPFDEHSEWETEFAALETPEKYKNLVLSCSS